MRVKLHFFADCIGRLYHGTRQNLKGEGRGKEGEQEFSPMHLLSKRDLIPATKHQPHSHPWPQRRMVRVEESQFANISCPRSHGQDASISRNEHHHEGLLEAARAYEPLADGVG